MKKIKTNRVVSMILVSVFILSLVCPFMVANAGTSFKPSILSSDPFGNSHYSIPNKSELYPYNSDSAKITSVGLDVLYGVNKDIINFYGELPWKETRDDDGELSDGGFSNLPVRDVEFNNRENEESRTSIKGENPGYGKESYTSAKNYWGVDDNDNSIPDSPSKGDLEQVNQDEIKSLRLYGISEQGGYGVGSILYGLGRALAAGSLDINSILVSAKNIDMNSILSILRLEDLGKFLTKTFIYDGDLVKLSPFTMIALAMFIFAIAVYAIKFASGKGSKQELWKKVGIAFIALLVIGAALTGRLGTLGSSVADFTSKMLYTAAEGMASGDRGKAFNLDVSDAQNENKVVQLSEMSMLNKAFIDLQICNQFGVEKISDLNVENLGDFGGGLATEHLSGITNGVDFNQDFNGNIGYYYWYATSNVYAKTPLNASYPEGTVKGVTAEDSKLASMITYLQVLYNQGDDNQKSKIANIISSFADTNVWSNLGVTLLFIVVLVLLFICLLQYGIKVIVSKIGMFVSILGITVAGPLMLTTNPKLVKTGKQILGMMIVSFIEITVWSILFDIVLYVTAFVVQGTALSELAAIALLILFLTFKKKIDGKIQQALASVTNKISPEVGQLRDAAQRFGRNKKDQLEKWNNRDREIGTDANGNPIYGKKPNKLIQAVTTVGGSALGDRENVLGKMIENKHRNDDYKADNQKTLRHAKQDAFDKALGEVKTTSEGKTEAQFNPIQEAWDKFNNGYSEERDKIGHASLEQGLDGLDMTKLTHEEQKQAAQFQDKLAKLEMLKAEKARLEEKKANNQTLSNKEKSTLAQYGLKAVALQKDAQNEMTKLNETIDERVLAAEMQKQGFNHKIGANGMDEVKEQILKGQGNEMKQYGENVSANLGIDYNSFTDDEKDNFLKATKEKISEVEYSNTVKERADELKDLGEQVIIESNDEVNNVTHKDKQGEKINKEAITSQAVVKTQLGQIQDIIDGTSTTQVDKRSTLEKDESIQNVVAKVVATKDYKKGTIESASTLQAKKDMENAPLPLKPLAAIDYGVQRAGDRKGAKKDAKAFTEEAKNEFGKRQSKKMTNRLDKAMRDNK